MATRGETPTRHYDEKLEAILKCAAKIFAEKGYHSTSIRDISRETGMSLAGLYYYFRSKEELLFLSQERCILTLLQRWETVNPDADARVRIRIFAENHLGFFLHNMHEMKVMAREDESLTGDFQEQMLVLKRRYVKILMDVIGEVQGRESVRVVDTRIATFSLFGMMNWIYTWYHPKRDLPLPQLIEQMLRIYFFGMLKGGEAAEPWFTSDAAQRDDASFSLWRNLPD